MNLQIGNGKNDFYSFDRTENVPNFVTLKSVAGDIIKIFKDRYLKDRGFLVEQPIQPVGFRVPRHQPLIKIRVQYPNITKI